MSTIGGFLLQLSFCAQCETTIFVHSAKPPISGFSDFSVFA
jgi:hypothetical protein